MVSSEKVFDTPTGRAFLSYAAEIRDQRRLAPAQRHGSCWYCGLPLGEDDTTEHLVARARGGARLGPENLRRAHADCNVVAADLPLEAKIALRDMMRDSPSLLPRREDGRLMVGAIHRMLLSAPPDTSFFTAGTIGLALDRALREVARADG